MQKLANVSLSNRRLLTVVAISALLAAFFLIKLPAVRSTAAGPTILPILSPCTTAGITAAGLPQIPGTTVTLTATTTDCPTPEYRFLLLPPGTATWIFQTAYGSANTYAWDTTKATPGIWQIGVWARQTGTLARYNAYAISTVAVAIPYCTAESVQANADLTVATTIHVYASEIGCPTPFIEFWMLAPGSSTWVLAKPWFQDFGVNNRYDWDTIGLPRGPYQWGVWARQKGSGHRYDAYGIVTYWLT